MSDLPLFSPSPPPAEPLPATIARTLTYIAGHLGQPLLLAELAAVAGLSVWRFATVFRQTMGISPHQYVCARRVDQAELLLRQGMAAAKVASETGFYDQSHLARHFKSARGLTPGQFQGLSARRLPAMAGGAADGDARHAC
ncbi:AraC family transcriptional regulator [Ideonella azotifigens]|nr:AraC family transcriptional regulator [Ideonella azotifigens]MCD2342513.1 AraC family transcriptional regulator [Ideonella azotifigens]